jgi:hypothetical protein
MECEMVAHPGAEEEEAAGRATSVNTEEQGITLISLL